MAERELDQLFQAWRSEPVPPSLPAAEDRGGSVLVAAALRRVAEQKRRRQRLRRWGAALAVAAGLSGLGVGTWYSLAPASGGAASAQGVLMAAREGQVAITDGVGDVVSHVSALGEGYGVRTEQGHVTLGFPSGAQATVAHRSALKITATRAKEALFLASGAVDVEVPKLDPERGFSVETPDARVTVHGTRFQVTVEPTPSGPRTRVEVTHGVVAVQQGGQEVFLSAGQSWPKQAAPSEHPAAEPSEPGPLEDADAGASSAEHERMETSGSLHERPRARDPRLADQNRRFTRAMNRKKAGDLNAALRELGQLMRRHPGSPLAQEARVERLRMLQALGRDAAAAREAERYVREFPDGYAVSEARALLAGRP